MRMGTTTDKMVAALARDHYTNMIQGLVTVGKAAEMIGVSPRRVRALIQAGRIRAIRLGRCWYMRREDVLAFMAKPRKVGHPPSNPRPSKRDTRLSD